MQSLERSLGPRATFLLPSLKLKRIAESKSTFEQAVHVFLISNFDGYTATTGNLFGYWKDAAGNDSYGEHRQFAVALKDESKIDVLKRYLARLATEIDEDCIFLETAGSATLIYREKPE